MAKEGLHLLAERVQEAEEECVNDRVILLEVKREEERGNLEKRVAED